MFPNVQNHINGDWAFGNMLNNPDEFIMMQYTGLKDKNGVEIYEGDIIKLSHGKHYWMSEVKRLGGQFGNNLYAMCFEDNLSTDEETQYFTFKPRKVSGVRYSIPYTGDVVVLGNIYENPELSEGD